MLLSYWSLLGTEPMSWPFNRSALCRLARAATSTAGFNMILGPREDIMSLAVRLLLKKLLSNDAVSEKSVG